MAFEEPLAVIDDDTIIPLEVVAPRLFCYHFVGAAIIILRLEGGGGEEEEGGEVRESHGWWWWWWWVTIHQYIATTLLFPLLALLNPRPPLTLTLTLTLTSI